MLSTFYHILRQWKAQFQGSGRKFQGIPTFRLWYGYHLLLLAICILRVGAKYTAKKFEYVEVEAIGGVVSKEISTVKKKPSIFYRIKKKDALIASSAKPHHCRFKSTKL